MMHIVYRLQDEKDFEMYKKLMHELNEWLKAKAERLNAAQEPKSY